MSLKQKEIGKPQTKKVSFRCKKCFLVGTVLAFNPDDAIKKIRGQHKKNSPHCPETRIEIILKG